MIAKVLAATPAARASIIDTLVLAFVADPVARWCYSAPSQYLANMPRFAMAFSGGAFDHNTAHCIQDYSGAALWLPPGVHPDEEAVERIVEQTTSESVRNDLVSVMIQRATYQPNEPHWYLSQIGVDPAHRGKGHGGALLAHGLQQCDRDGCVAYLESSNPRNVSLYERHGFKAIGKIQAGTSPWIVAMLRTPA